MNNNNNNKLLIKNHIKENWVINLLILINSFVLYDYYFYIYVLVILLISIKFKKYWWVFLIPAVKHHLFLYRHENNIKNIGVIYYSVKSTCRKNTYLIKIHKIHNINKDIKFLEKKLGVFLYSKCVKDYFTTYKSHIYIINENFIFETKILKTYKNTYKQILEKIFNKVIKVTTYSSVINSLLLSIKDNSQKENKNIYKVFKETGTWHLLCVGGLHIHILRNILNYITRVVFEVFLLKNIHINGNFLKFSGYMEGAFICIYGLINSLNSWSVPTMRALATYMIYNFFYFQNRIFNHLWIFLMIIWGFLFINGNYIYDLGFQMSFLSVYFLMGFSEFLYKINRWLVGKLSKIIGKTFISEIINLFMVNCFIGGVLIGYSFYLHDSFNLLSLLANIITIPIFYIIISLNFLGLISGVFWKINDFIIGNILNILHVFNKYPISITYKLNKSQLLIYSYGVFTLISILIIINIYIIKYFNYKQKLEDKYYENYIIYVNE
jgi:hypothetical protein